MMNSRAHPQQASNPTPFDREASVWLMAHANGCMNVELIHRAADRILEGEAHTVFQTDVFKQASVAMSRADSKDASQQQQQRDALKSAIVYISQLHKAQTSRYALTRQ